MWKPTEAQKKVIEAAEKAGKEFFYVGHYYDIEGKYVLKLGTTDNLRRRRTEHNQNYRKAKRHTMPPDGEFIYDWFIPLSKYNTLRVEDRTKTSYREIGFGEYLNNDRFIFDTKPASLKIKVRKTYEIAL